MSEILIIAYHVDGWCVFVTVPNETPRIVSGPYAEHSDAIQAAETRAHRLRQGWQP